MMPAPGTNVLNAIKTICTSIDGTGDYTFDFSGTGAVRRGQPGQTPPCIGITLNLQRFEINEAGISLTDDEDLLPVVVLVKVPAASSSETDVEDALLSAVEDVRTAVTTAALNTELANDPCVIAINQIRLAEAKQEGAVIFAALLFTITYDNPRD